MKRAPARKGLFITATPFRSSRLAVPPSPFSPRLPITPPPAPPKSPSTTSRSRAVATASSRGRVAPPIVPPPRSPAGWAWQCHLCRRQYRVGVTRRCLEDGHAFCTGRSSTTTVKVRRKGGGGARRVVRRHHRACPSEFDYDGWRAWGDWRRVEEELRRCGGGTTAGELVVDGKGRMLAVHRQWRAESDGLGGEDEGGPRNCWSRCVFPSQCHWSALVPQSSASEAASELSQASKDYDAVRGALTIAPRRR